MATASPALPDVVRAANGPLIRVVCRSASGETDLNFPLERVADAIADKAAVVWVDILRPEADLPGVEALFRDVFDFHALAIEDALSESHVPKIDDWGRYLYLVFHTMDFDPETDKLRLHELDLFLGHNYLVSCHSEPMPTIETLRKRLESDPERCERGPDHLLYHILDGATDNFMPAIEHLDEAIDAAQDEVFGRPTTKTLQQILQIKRSAVKVHRILAPQREVLNRLARDTYAQVDAPDRVYFRDVYDHLVRLHDVSESLRDLITGALDTYLSAIANRTNEVMKTLTLVTVMFLPLTFLVGFFGMNFFGDNIVLRDHPARAVLFWGNNAVMLAIPIALGAWAWRQGWFGGSDGPR